MKARFTRLLVIVVIATAVSAISSVLTATISFVSHNEARTLREELDTKWALITKPATALSDAQREAWFRETEPPAVKEFDALPAGEPMVISRALVEGLLLGADDNAPARIVPFFKGGRAVGSKIFSIKPESMYAQLGWMNGDVVMHINGLALTHPDDITDAYAQLKDATSFSVDITRRGALMRLNYVVRDDAEGSR